MSSAAVVWVVEKGMQSFIKKLFSILNEMKSTSALLFANDLYHYISILLCINIQVKLAGPRRAVGRAPDS